MGQSTRKTIGPWNLGRQIARSGQAEVFEGTRLDEEGGKTVAVKVIRLSSAKKAARFKTEVDSHKALSDEKTANIMPILDYSLQASQGQGYIAMPMAAASLSGDAQFFHRRVELCLSAFIGVVNGLVGAHAKGVIHRDIKPGNILFEDPYLQVPLVSDFGICLLKDTPREERVTAVDETVGAKFFMAPEQEKGGVADVGETADIYAVGKLLHFMITGRYLFREELENAFNEEELKTDRRLTSVHQEILARTIVASPDSRMGTARELLQISRDLLASFRQ